MNRRSKSTLFLMEQLIVVATFAICAAACVKILASSYFIASETRDINNAIRAAQTGAECYKAVSGDIGEMARILDGYTFSVDGADSVVMYYDNNWEACGEANAQYVFRLVSGAPGPASLQTGELSVAKLIGEEIIAFSVAVEDK